MLTFEDIVIDPKAVKIFLDRWSSFDLSLEDFTKMLVDSTNWHNIPLAIIQTVVKFECGYPNRFYSDRKGKRNPYSSRFNASPTFVGPFQESNLYLAGVKQNAKNDLYVDIKLPDDIKQCTLGLQLYIMIADKVRLSRMKVKGKTFGHAPCNAATLYGLHLRPEMLAAILRKTVDFSITMPSRVYAGQSDLVNSYFNVTKISSAQPLKLDNVML